jgi:hypothetical protein
LIDPGVNGEIFENGALKMQDVMAWNGLICPQFRDTPATFKAP